MTRASDTARLLGAGGTFGGAITSNSGIVIDDITIDGTEIDLSSGDITLDAGGDIKLDVAGGDIKFLFGGTEFGEIRNISNDLNIISSIADKDIVFKGQDDSSEIEAMRIDMSEGGKVGIGTSSPTKDLTIQGTGATLRLEDNTSGRYADIENSDGRMILRSDPDNAVASSRFVFEVDGSEHVRINNDGQFCVGTTSAGLHKAIVSANTGGNAVFKVANTATSGNTTTYISFMDGSGSASVNSAHFQGFNGANNHYLLGNGTTTFTSDEVAKKNIETTRDGYLEDLAKLRVVKYNWKEDEDGTDKELGLIAQEVEKVFPKLVMLDFDPQIADKDKKKMIKVSVLPFMLLKALQEANTKIEALEARIATLESK